MKNLLLLFALLTFSSHSFLQEQVKCGNAKSTTKGFLKDSSDLNPIIIMTSGDKPEIGSIGELAKVSESPGMTMKISIGLLKVIEINGDEIKCEVIEKKSVVRINGVERSHYIPETPVEFEAFEYDTETMTEIKYESGSIKEKGAMLCGKKVGKWEEFNEDGSLAAKYELNDDGEIIGDYKSYYSDGSVEWEGEYRYGKKSGTWTEYFEDGEIKSQGYYYNGSKSGKWIEHNEKGKKVKVKY